MVSQWQDQLPAGTPNYFMMNITDDEKQTLTQHFTDNHVDMGYLYPVVRGRFVSINGEQINTKVNDDDEDGSESEGRDGLGREANLTWDLELHNENKIVDGEWHKDWVNPNSDEPTLYPVSVEKDLAQRLSLELGDELTFNIGSEIVHSRITVSYTHLTLPTIYSV